MNALIERMINEATAQHGHSYRYASRGSRIYPVRFLKGSHGFEKKIDNSKELKQELEKRGINYKEGVHGGKLYIRILK